MQKQTIALSILMIGAWIPSVFGHTSQTDTIEQEPYRFQMDVTQTVTPDTFVITEGNKPDNETYSKKDKKLDSTRNDTSTSRKTLTTVVFSTCLFQFDSPVLIPSEIDKTLTFLTKKNLQNTPLAVTGYTCSLGPKEYNQALSLQRAEAIADFLQTHGFVIATVQGKGSQNPVTNDSHQFRLNRRVTIQAVKK